MRQCWVWSGRIQRCYNVATTFKMNVISQRSGNVASMLVLRCSNVATTLENFIILWHCHNIVTTLKTTIYHNVQATFCECYLNVGANIEIRPNYNIQATLWQHWKWRNFNVATTLCEHCGNIVSMLWADQSTNVHTTLYQWWEITLFSTLSKHCYNFGGTHQESKIQFPILEIKFRIR